MITSIKDKGSGRVARGEFLRRILERTVWAGSDASEKVSALNCGEKRHGQAAQRAIAGLLSERTRYGSFNVSAKRFSRSGAVQLRFGTLEFSAAKIERAEAVSESRVV